MENKYYTPIIEEFHVGFEYTHKDLNCKLFINEDLIKSNFTVADLRVKYLDREDIESLGFKHDGSLWFSKDNWKLRKWKASEIDLYYCFGTINMMGEEDKELRFRGTIKNKSELKKLMKQLNIL